MEETRLVLSTQYNLQRMYYKSVLLKLVMNQCHHNKCNLKSGLVNYGPPLRAEMANQALRPNPTSANNGHSIFKWLKKKSFDGTQDYMKFKFQYLKIKFHSSPNISAYMCYPWLLLCYKRPLWPAEPEIFLLQPCGGSLPTPA